MNMQQAESARIQAVVSLFADYATKVPADKIDWKPEPSTKSPKEILEHMAAANRGFASMIEGVDLGITMDKTERANVNIPAESMADAIEGLKSSGAKLSEAISNLEDSQLAETRDMPWGETWDMPRLIVTSSTHISYHWGQLAYLQTMWGDTDDHM